MATALVVASVPTSGQIAIWTILSVGLFNSIMSPCIFAMGIAELGPSRVQVWPLEYGYCGRSSHPMAGREDWRHNQPSLLSGDDSGRDGLGQGYSLCSHRRGPLLSLHFVLCGKRIQTEQRALR
jgi:hypothetical protein